MRQITFFVYLIPYTHPANKDLERVCVLWGTTPNSKNVAYALVNADLVNKIKNTHNIFPTVATPYIGTWRYHNNVIWNVDKWQMLWSKLGPFVTAEGQL